MDQILPILGAIGGGAARLLPELLKFLDRWLDRRHEIEMQEIALRFEELHQADPQKRDLYAPGATAQFSAGLDALKSAVTEQLHTGIRWIDIYSSAVRPSVTYALIILYGITKLAQIASAWPDVGIGVWGNADMALLNGILSFWFMSRALLSK